MKSRNADRAFFVGLALIGGTYVLLVMAIIAANILFTTPGHLIATLRDPYIRSSLLLTMWSSFVSASLSLAVAVPLGYLLARTTFRGKGLLEAILDTPIILPPLVVGLSLLLIFNQFRLAGVSFEEWLNERSVHVTYATAGVVLAQFAVAAAFSVRTMRGTFEQIPIRLENVALTLGCSRWEAFKRVTIPLAQRGMLSAFTIAWARSFGEFGPLLIFAGTTRGHTEVLSSSVYLELGNGRLEGASAVSLLMIGIAVVVLIIVRKSGGLRP